MQCIGRLWHASALRQAIQALFPHCERISQCSAGKALGSKLVRLFSQTSDLSVILYCESNQRGNKGFRQTTLDADQLLNLWRIHRQPTQQMLLLLVGPNATAAAPQRNAVAQEERWAVQAINTDDLGWQTVDVLRWVAQHQGHTSQPLEPGPTCSFTSTLSDNNLAAAQCRFQLMGQTNAPVLEEEEEEAASTAPDKVEQEQTQLPLPAELQQDDPPSLSPRILMAPSEGTSRTLEAMSASTAVAGRSESVVVRSKSVRFQISEIEEATAVPSPTRVEPSLQPLSGLNEGHAHVAPPASSELTDGGGGVRHQEVTARGDSEAMARQEEQQSLLHASVAMMPKSSESHSKSHATTDDLLSGSFGQWTGSLTSLEAFARSMSRATSSGSRRGGRSGSSGGGALGSMSTASAMSLLNNLRTSDGSSVASSASPQLMSCILMALRSASRAGSHRTAASTRSEFFSSDSSRWAQLRQAVVGDPDLEAELAQLTPADAVDMDALAIIVPSTLSSDDAAGPSGLVASSPPDTTRSTATATAGGARGSPGDGLSYLELAQATRSREGRSLIEVVSYMLAVRMLRAGNTSDGSQQQPSSLVDPQDESLAPDHLEVEQSPNDAQRWNSFRQIVSETIDIEKEMAQLRSEWCVIPGMSGVASMTPPPLAGRTRAMSMSHIQHLSSSNAHSTNASSSALCVN